MINAVLIAIGCRKPFEREKEVSEGIRVLSEVNLKSRLGLEQVLEDLIRDNHNLGQRQGKQ